MCMSVPAGQHIFMYLVPSGVQCRPVQTSTHSGWRKNLWTLNDSLPLHSILIRHCYLWERGRGCQALHESLIFSHLPLLSCHCWPIICEISCGRRKSWWYKMDLSNSHRYDYYSYTGRTKTKKWIFVTQGCRRTWIEQLGIEHFAFHLIFLSGMGLGWGMTGFR